MKINRTILGLLALVSLFFCGNAHAFLAVPVYSGMYNLTSSNGLLGTVGSTEGWKNNNSFITVTNGVGSLDGTGLGLVASTGDRAFISSSASSTYVAGTYNLFADKYNYPQNTNVDIYISFLCKFDNVSGLAAASPLCQMNLQNSSSTVYWQMQVSTNASGQVQLGMVKNPANGTVAFATTNINVGDTFFVVVRYQILPGTADDVVDLWINPPASSFGANEASVPPTSVSTVNGTEPNSTTGPGRFYLDVVTNLTAEFDELRIATNWASVTPAFGSCVSAGIYQNPVSQTNVSGIADTFTVIASPSSTSPTYQWQTSPSNTVAWANISGATFSSYTTPNLDLATDNGNQYRCIVTVPCDGSSATSSVATVTLTAPIPTAPGVVLNDTFNTGAILEPVLPITGTNAAWYTADSTKLDIYSTPGTMIATPVSLSSSLWLAYFTPTDSIPVHLTVGNSIKVTCPFTPNSYTYFTGNGSLRIGLFDYADGGIRVTNDDSTVSGSGGNGVNVRGYMLSLDFGPTFTANSPLSLLARNNLNDANLMGTTADYVSLGSGPSGGGFAGAPAFTAGTQYTLVTTITRNGQNSVLITNSITGGGTNWTYSVTETNMAYHRFDAFGIRPQSLETTADSFNIAQLKVEVLAGAVSPASITMGTITRSGNTVSLQWTPSPAGSYTYTVQRKTNLTDATWTTLQSGVSTASYSDTTATGSTGFYRVTSP